MLSSSERRDSYSIGKVPRRGLYSRGFGGVEALWNLRDVLWCCAKVQGPVGAVSGP